MNSIIQPGAACFCRGQQVGGTGPSDFAIDMAHIGRPPGFCLAVVRESFGGNGTIAVALQDSDAPDFAQPRTLLATGPRSADDLQAGATVMNAQVPQRWKQYLRLLFTVEGDCQGRLDASLIELPRRF